MEKGLMWNADLIKYCQAHSTSVDDVLLELERDTHIKELVPQMISGNFQGKLMQLLSVMIQPKYVLEIGTFTGFSAICWAAGLQQGGRIHTIEVNEELESMILNYFEKANVQEKIKLHIGNALEIIPTLKETFDIVFIDAKKTDYKDYYKLVFEKVRPGGFIFADNVVWDGKVLNNNKDPKTQAIVDFNKMIMDDPRVENLMLPFSDGITIARKLNG